VSLLSSKRRLRTTPLFSSGGSKACKDHEHCGALRLSGMPSIVREVATSDLRVHVRAGEAPDALCWRRGPDSQAGCPSCPHCNGGSAFLSGSDHTRLSIRHDAQDRVFLALSKLEHIHSCASRFVPHPISSDHCLMDVASAGGSPHKQRASAVGQFSSSTAGPGSRTVCMGLEAWDTTSLMSHGRGN
jgi:hypothetical protein